MRVLHVINSLAKTFGGPTTVVYGLANGQARSGLEVAICTTNRGTHSDTLLTRDEIQASLVNDISLYSFTTDRFPMLVSRHMRRWLIEHIDEFDIVHVHGLYRFPATYASYLARKKHVPYVIRTHGNLSPYLYGKSSRSVFLKRVYERWFDLPNLNAAGAIHYTTEEERQRAAFLKLRAPSFVVPNGLDWSQYQGLPSRGALRARWVIGESPMVLFLGRLNFEKGLDLLVSAFDALRRKLPAVQLVIAGPENDGYGQKVRGWVHERGLDDAVHFVGMLKGVDVIQAYADADVFVLPSYTESFGMTVVEAMACGLPVVISDQVNIHREVSAAGAALVTRCDAAEIANALETLLLDGERQQLMGEAGRRLAQERYAWPAIVDELTKQYRAVIERHRQSASSGKPKWQTRA